MLILFKILKLSKIKSLENANYMAFSRLNFYLDIILFIIKVTLAPSF